MTTGKTIALTTQIFVGNVMSLLFNTLPRFVTAFLPRSKRHLILWLQLSSTVILEPKKIKSVSVSTFPPSICHEVMGLDVMILDIMDWSPPGFSVRGVLQARILEWVAMPSSRGSFPPRDGNHTLYVSWLVSSLLLVPTVLLALDIQTPLWVCIFALLLS